MYHVSILGTASKELKKLDKDVSERVVKRINWLSENVEIVDPEALSGDLSGLYKLRVGDYRVLYEILRDEKTIVIYAIGHRREIYRKR